jgi:pantothenate kinase-related protein Tda10
MKLEQFLRHHGITGNPFSEEDAQTDTVFKRLCMATIHHPAWNKFFGSPADPSTALVFGEKGSGKTALRLQASAELEQYNQDHPAERVLVVSYDDFNPYLDSCRIARRAETTDQVLETWRLQDHVDAILSLAVTQLVDSLTADPAPRSAALGGSL